MRRFVVFCCVIVAGLLVPALATARARKPGPDLKVTGFEVHLGSPAHALVGTDGVLVPIEVQVVTENMGDRAAGASVTEVFFEDSAHHRFQTRIQVPKLEPNAPFGRTVEIKGAKPALGFAQLGAIADVGKQNNLFPGEQFAIVARQWDVKSFDTITKVGNQSHTTFIRGGFRFVFSRYDHASENYVYKPYGGITDQASVTGICTGSSNKTATHSPWADSYLEIASDLGGYDAVVQPALTDAYSFTASCFGVGSHTYNVKFQQLLTFAGQHRQPTMKPRQEQLDGSVMDSLLRTTWQWDFRAALG